MKRLFVDTAGWMSMMDAKDPLHTDTVLARDLWMEEGGILVATDYVFDETLTLIRMRLGLDAAEKWWEMASASPRCSLEWMTPERVEKATTWFFGWKDQSFSFTDCTSFVIMKELQIEKVLTSDRHFAIAGFQMVPGYSTH